MVALLVIIQDPVFRKIPDAWRIPVALPAILATIIASQAVISGAFSLTQQAIQLGFMPRLRVDHTSASAQGQIYIPVVNWGLMVMVILLVLFFGSSSNLARSEEHTSELQSLMRISYAVFCLKKKINQSHIDSNTN